MKKTAAQSPGHRAKQNKATAAGRDIKAATLSNKLGHAIFEDDPKTLFDLQVLFLFRPTLVPQLQTTNIILFHDRSV